MNTFTYQECDTIVLKKKNKPKLFIPNIPKMGMNWSMHRQAEQITLFKLTHILIMFQFKGILTESTYPRGPW